MHQIPAYETTVTLFSHAGPVAVYPSLKAALKALGAGWIDQNVGEHFRVFRHNSRYFCTKREIFVYEPFYDTYAYVMRDDAGAPITRAHFQQLIVRRWRSRWYSRFEHWNGEGPVPGIHRARGGRYYRRPQTTNERRQAALVLKEEGEVAPRCARNGHHLASAWDDIYFKARDNNNWKRYRRTQWKAPRD